MTVHTFAVHELCVMIYLKSRLGDQKACHVYNEYTLIFNFDQACLPNPIVGFPVFHKHQWVITQPWDLINYVCYDMKFD